MDAQPINVRSSRVLDVVPKPHPDRSSKSSRHEIPEQPLDVWFHCDIRIRVVMRPASLLRINLF
ncbi:MAG: hypothetical protein QGG09_22540, partial [Pirellulaceae bacterium]|nr:hypothetical protein [Pirellulaceae bacterium]